MLYHIERYSFHEWYSLGLHDALVIIIIIIIITSAAAAAAQIIPLQIIPSHAHYDSCVCMRDYNIGSNMICRLEQQQQ